MFVLLCVLLVLFYLFALCVCVVRDCCLFSRHFLRDVVVLFVLHAFFGLVGSLVLFVTFWLVFVVCVVCVVCVCIVCYVS